MGKVNIFIIIRNEEDRNFILSVMAKHKDLRIIGMENDESSAIIKSEKLKPDVLIMDLHSSGIDGAELAPIILRRSPSTSIVMMCDRDENDYANAALKAGISGFLLRAEDMNKLIPIIKIVNMGGYFISASITQRALDNISVLKQMPGQFIDRRNNCPSFTLKERRIIKEVAQGLPDKEIAKHLNYSPGAVKNCITAIKRKTKLRNRIQIAVYSLVYGLIDLKQLNIGAQKI